MKRRRPGIERAAICGLGVAALMVATLATLTPPSSFEAQPAAGPAVPLGFTLANLNGTKVDLSAFKGKIVLLNFWATWCGPCRAEIPDLIDLQMTYPDDVAVVGIVVLDRFGENVSRFAAELQINYPVLDATARPDVEAAFAPMWGLPTTIVIGRDGRIARKHSGIGSKEQFARDIEALL